MVEAKAGAYAYHNFNVPIEVTTQRKRKSCTASVGKRKYNIRVLEFQRAGLKVQPKISLRQVVLRKYSGRVRVATESYNPSHYENFNRVSP